jgi:hypothetical protein
MIKMFLGASKMVPQVVNFAKNIFEAVNGIESHQ